MAAVIDGAWQVVHERTFLKDAKAPVDGLAGYVRAFLNDHAGKVNQHGRPWTVELCAELLQVPPPTLRRWVGKTRADQGKPAPVLPTAKAEQVKSSHAKAALRDPDQRRAVIEELPTDVRKGLRADLRAVDATSDCLGCPEHCPTS